nr:hypothetical protein [uncultured Allomuricauda sp.]
MNSVKITIALASSVLIFLLGLLLFIKNSEKDLYDQTVEMVMAHQGLTTTDELGKFCPELNDIKRKMDQIGRLNSNIHSLTAGPAPNISENQSEAIFAMTDEIETLRKDVRIELTKLMNTYSEGQPAKLADLGN